MGNDLTRKFDKTAQDVFGRCSGFCDGADLVHGHELRYTRMTPNDFSVPSSYDLSCIGLKEKSLDGGIYSLGHYEEMPASRRHLLELANNATTMTARVEYLHQALSKSSMNDPIFLHVLPLGTSLDTYLASKFGVQHLIGRLTDVKDPDYLKQFDKMDASILYDIGITLSYNSSMDRIAVNAFRMAVAINPTVAEFHVNLCQALLRSQLDDEALAVLKRGIKHCPKSPLLEWKLGSILLQNNDFDRGVVEVAISHLRKALVLDSTCVNYALSLEKGLHLLITMNYDCDGNKNSALVEELGRVVRMLTSLDEANNASLHRYQELVSYQRRDNLSHRSLDIALL